MTDLEIFRETFPNAVVGLTATSPFGQKAGAAQDAVNRAAIESGHPHGPFALEWRLQAAKEVSAIRFKMAASALGIRQRELARRLGVDPATLSRIVNLKTAASWSLEKALYRELLAVALDGWVRDWACEEPRQQFYDALTTIDAGQAFTDPLELAQIALAAVTGTDGWPDFWGECGRFVTPIPSFENSAQFLAGQVAQSKRDALEAAAE